MAASMLPVQQNYGCYLVFTYTVNKLQMIQVTVRLIQQWLAVNGKPRNLVVSSSVPQDWMSQLVFSIGWNPAEVDPKASEAMDVLAS